MAEQSYIKALAMASELGDTDTAALCLLNLTLSS